MARESDSKLLWWLLAGLGGAAALAYMNRQTIMIYGSKALQAGNEAIFKASLSTDAQPYGDLILQVARETGVDPFLIYALGEHESRWGEALTPPGPAGTGDSGHGRGLMQIDDRSFADWLASNDWTDPYTNMNKGVSILQSKLAELGSTTSLGNLAPGNGLITIGPQGSALFGIPQGTVADPRPLTGDLLTQAAIAAYNAGSYNVIRQIAVQGPNSLNAATTGGNYESTVWNLMASAASSFQAASSAA